MQTPEQVNYNDYTGRTLDQRFQIIKKLGSGAMGAVYLGKQIALDRKVAVKFLHATFLDNSDVVKRFEQEAKTPAKLNHENIIGVIDRGISPENEPYIVMDYLEGEDLSSLLNRTGPLSLQAAYAIIKPVLLGLSAAHVKGIIHRDLKPENIFIAHEPNGGFTVKIIDFGVCKVTSSDDLKLTATGGVLGTLNYMAPEQLKAMEVDERTDLYAVGVILYEMLTGRLPIEAENFYAITQKIVNEEPMPPNEAYEEFPIEVSDLLMSILSKSPEDRPQSATEILGALQKLTESSDNHQEPKEFTSGIIPKTVAGGDLGALVKEGSDESEEAIPPGPEPKNTPTEWLNKKREIRGRTSLFIGVSVSFLFVAIIIGVLLLRPDDRRNEAVVPASPVPVQPNPNPTSYPLPQKPPPPQSERKTPNNPIVKPTDQSTPSKQNPEEEAEQGALKKKGRKQKSKPKKQLGKAKREEDKSNDRPSMAKRTEKY